mmetsp:Transcript_1801/g.2509  ORF Transcript_1801/g.2509 Transcript_1801/m.2509 type:complete len:255 (-) Transcript_1801:589-1353(-)
MMLLAPKQMRSESMDTPQIDTAPTETWSQASKAVALTFRRAPPQHCSSSPALLSVEGSPMDMVATSWKAASSSSALFDAVMAHTPAPPTDTCRNGPRTKAGMEVSCRLECRCLTYFILPPLSACWACTIWLRVATEPQQRRSLPIRVMPQLTASDTEICLNWTLATSAGWCLSAASSPGSPASCSSPSSSPSSKPIAAALQPPVAQARWWDWKFASGSAPTSLPTRPKQCGYALLSSTQQNSDAQEICTNTPFR